MTTFSPCYPKHLENVADLSPEKEVGMEMDDKSRKDQRHQPGITDCFCFADRISCQKPNRESLRGLFWEVELPWGGDRAVPTATAPHAAVLLLPKMIHTGFEGTFGTEDRHFRFFCQRKLLERMFQSKDN